MPLLKETLPGGKSFDAQSSVYLEAGHIIIGKTIARPIFGSESVVLTIFYQDSHTFMAAPAGEELFRTIHKANQQMLKSKNVLGDRSISIQELLLDNDLDDTDRNLEFSAEEKLHILTVKL